MDIDNNQIRTRKQIGHVGETPVQEFLTKGGFHLIVLMGAKKKVLGVGSHRGIARHIASQTEPRLEITALEKSEPLSQLTIETVVPRWVEVTRVWSETASQLPTF